MCASDTRDDEMPQRNGANTVLRRNWLPFVGIAVCLCVLIVGLWLTFGAGDVGDFNRYRAFTSPAQQRERCAAQDAIATQVKIREHFEAAGGITDEQATAMAPVVGLTPSEMREVVEAELAPLDLGCHDSYANPQIVVVGLVLITGASAALGGLLVGATARRCSKGLRSIQG